MNIQSINRKAFLSFVTELRSNQFHCGIDTILTLEKTIQYIEEKYKNKPNSDQQFLSDVKTTLSSIICTNYQESQRFNDLFDKSFIQSQINVKKEGFDRILLPIFKETLSDFRASFKKKTNRFLFAFVSILAIFLLWYIFIPGPCAKFTFLSEDVIFKKKGSPISVTDFITIDVKDTADFAYEAYLHKQHLKSSGYKGILNFSRIGGDSLTIILKPKKCKCKDKTKFHYNLFVGPENNSTIEPLKNSTINTNEKNTFTYMPDSAISGEFTWYIDKITKQEWINANQIQQTFNSEGNFNIEVRYNNFKDTILNQYADQYTIRYIQDVENSVLDIKYTTNKVNYSSTYDINIIYIFLFVVLLLIFLAVGFYRYFNKKKAAQAKDTPDDNQPTELKGPFHIPFKLSEEAIHKSKEIIDLGKFLKDKGRFDGLKFDIKSTIRTTIKNKGFIAPSFRERIVKSKYIILIDKIFNNSQPFHLFVYLVNHLINETLDVEIYYYYQFPKFLYSPENEENEITINQLLESDSESKIFVFSSGTSLLSFAQPMMKAEYKALFSNWNDRILITPTPYLDWSNNEKWLAESFKIVPADINGLLHILHLLSNEEEENSAIFKQPYFETYSTKYVNFVSIDELKDYLKDEDLFQWMCALAVYPKIDWCLTIEIGKAVLGQNQHKINYENLLKLARTKWMFDGKFTSSDRFMLLKPLSFENELKARATILNVLDTMQLDESSFAYQESLVAKYINGFMLKASGAEGKSIYKLIYDSESINTYYSRFLYHQEKGNFMDVAFSNYVEKKGDGDWETPIRDHGDHNFQNNPTLSAYLDKLLEDKQKAFDLKRDPVIWVNILAALFCIFLSIFVNIDKENFYNSKLNLLLRIVIKVDVPTEQAYITISPPKLCKDFITSSFSELLILDNTEKELFSTDLKALQDSGYIKIPIDETWLISKNWGKRNKFSLAFLKTRRDPDNRSKILDSETLDFNIAPEVNYNFNVQSKKCQKIQIVYFENEELASILKNNLEKKYDIEMVKQSETITDLKIFHQSYDGLDSLVSLVSILSSLQPVIELNGDSSRITKIYLPDQAKSTISFNVNYHKSEFKIANLIRSYLVQNKYNVTSFRSSGKINESEITYTEFKIKPIVDRAYNLLYNNFYKPFKVRYSSNISFKQNKSKSDQTITINIGPLNECKLKDIHVSIIKTEINSVLFKLNPVFNKDNCSIDGKYQYTVVDEKINIVNSINARDFVLNKVEPFYDYNFSYDLRYNKFYKIGVLDFLTKEVLFTSDAFSIEEPVKQTPPEIKEPRIFNVKISSDKQIYEEEEIMILTINYESEGDIRNFVSEIHLVKNDGSLYKSEYFYLGLENPYYYRLRLSNIFKDTVNDNSGRINQISYQNEFLNIKLIKEKVNHKVEINNKYTKEIDRIVDPILFEFPIYFEKTKKNQNYKELEARLKEYKNEQFQIVITHVVKGKNNSKIIKNDLENLFKSYKIVNSKFEISENFDYKFPLEKNQNSEDLIALVRVKIIETNSNFNKLKSSNFRTKNR